MSSGYIGPQFAQSGRTAAIPTTLAMRPGQTSPVETITVNKAKDPRTRPILRLKHWLVLADSRISYESFLTVASA